MPEEVKEICSINFAPGLKCFQNEKTCCRDCKEWCLNRCCDYKDITSCKFRTNISN